MTDKLRAAVAAVIALSLLTPGTSADEVLGPAAPDLAERPTPPHPSDVPVPVRVVDVTGAPVPGLGPQRGAPTDADGRLMLTPGWHHLCGVHDGFRVDPDAEDQTWTLPSRCAVRLEPERSQPGTTLHVPFCDPVPFEGPLTIQAPCDGLTVEVASPAGALREVALAPRERPVERVAPSTPLHPLRVTARAPDGRPIPDAHLTVVWVDLALASVVDASRDAPRGAADLEAPEGAGVLLVGAAAEGYGWRTTLLGIGTPDAWLALDHLAPPRRRPDAVSVVLTPERRLPVRCAGLPNDDCDLLGGASCGWDDLPSRGGEVTCAGAGPHVIRVAHRSVLVPADDDVAWLDFRDDAAVEVRGAPDDVTLRLRGGRVARDREPHHVAGVPPGAWWLCATDRAHGCVTPPTPITLSPGERRVIAWQDLRAGRASGP